MEPLHLALGQEAWAYVVARLLSERPVGVPEVLTDKASVLDSFHIPTRYPNGRPEGAPFTQYGKLQSEETIANAGEIPAFVRDRMADSCDSISLA